MKDRKAVLVIGAEGGEAHAFGSDARKEEAMVSLVETIERDIAPIEVAVFNIGANVRFGITETTSHGYHKVWEMACFSGFLIGRELWFGKDRLRDVEEEIVRLASA